MIAEERQKLIDKAESDLAEESNRLLNLEQKGKGDTSYYKSQLKQFEEHMEYYSKLCQRHEELLEQENRKSDTNK